MTLKENVPLSTLTTLRVGGVARFVAECASEEDIHEALLFAHHQNIPWVVLGQGSNVLAPDAGFDGIVLLMREEDIKMKEEGSEVFLTAAAGVSWDALVQHAAKQGVWGIENLAGIPGTVGAAPVQNIGAYGMEVKDTITQVRVLNTGTGTIQVFSNEECAFGYRDSRFKHDKKYVILSVTFRLSKDGIPSLSYKDIAMYVETNGSLDTPAAVGKAVRSIRARKFPDLLVHGTAGSFFKNPTVSLDTYGALRARYPELPGFPNDHGVKVPLAFVLDKILSLRGYREGNVWLFDAQPLVLVSDTGARAGEIDAFANAIAARVHAVTNINIEREVQMLV